MLDGGAHMERRMWVYMRVGGSLRGEGVSGG